MGQSPGARAFLDASGGAPPSARAREAYFAAVEDGWADPRRLHTESRQAADIAAGAAEAIAQVLGVATGGIYLLPNPEMCFQRIIPGLHAAQRGRDAIVASAVERAGVLGVSRHASGDRVNVVPVDDLGRMDQAAFAQALASDGVALAIVQHANREIGTLQDLPGVHAATRAAGVPLLVDATASVGHLAAPAEWDALVAHPADWGGPQSLGVLALKPRTRWLATWPGQGFAAGPASVPAALSAAVALQERMQNLDETARRMRALVDRVRERAGALNGVRGVGDSDRRVPHLATLVVDGVDGEVVASELDRRGYAVGTGSACATGDAGASHVLDALGVAGGNVRLGLHPGVDEAQVDGFVAALAEVLAAVRR